MPSYRSILYLLLLPVWLLAHEGPRVKPSHDPHYFIENKGQWDENILFRAEIPQGRVLVTKEGILYQLASYQQDSASVIRSHSTNPHASKGKTRVNGQVIKVSFGQSILSNIEGDKQEQGKFQFLRGHDRSEWVQGAKAFKEVKIKNVYQGIDLRIYFHEGQIKYDFDVRPYADPKQIRMNYEGADSLSIANDHLIIHTTLGKIYERPPYSFLKEGKVQKRIPCHFKLQKNSVSFELPFHYDSSKPLVIDPELLFTTYSGSRADNWGNTATYDTAGNFYSGGIVQGDFDFPVTPGPFGNFRGSNAGDWDALILKYSPDGVNLLFAAYLGGMDVDIPISMIVDNNDNLVILGVTGSPDFPTSLNAFDRTYNGGVWADAFYNFVGTPIEPFQYAPEMELENGSDIFVTVIDTKGNNLVASTFLGGAQNDGLIMGSTSPIKNYGDQLRGEVMVDKNNNIFIASHTYSDTLNGIVPQPIGGNLDALAAKFPPDLSSVLWLYRNGGSGHDAGLGIRLDSHGDAFLTGGTNSANLFPSSILGLTPSLTGDQDGYILKLANASGIPISATYLGTSHFDQCYFVDVDYNDDVYVFGLTKGQYPVSPKVYSNPNSGQFIHKLRNDLKTSVFSTVFGSGKLDSKTGEINPDISPTAFMVNNCRKIFISGWGGEVNIPDEEFEYPDDNGNWHLYEHDQKYSGGNLIGMPFTSDAFQKTTNGTGFYFMILHPEALSLAYATYFSAPDKNKEHVDGGTSRFDKKGVIYQSICAGCRVCTGCRGNSNLPMPRTDVWSTTNNSRNCNNAAVKFDLGKVVADFTTIDSLADIPSVYGCVPITFLLKNKSSGATNYKWEIRGEASPEFLTKNDSIFIKFKTRGIKNLTLIAYDTSICRLVDTARAVINAGDVRADFPKDRINCGLQPFTADLELYTPWAKVKWEPATGVSDPNIPNPVITPTAGGITYKITVNDDTLCTKIDTFHVKTRMFDPKAQFKVFDSLKLQEKYTFCFPSTGFFKSYSTDYDSLWWEENNAPILAGVDSFYYAFSQLGKIKYKLHVLDTACKKTDEQEKLVIISFPYVTFPNDVKVCPDSSALVKVIGEKSNTYLWTPSHLFADPHASEQHIHPDSSGTVYILVTDSVGCQTSGSFKYGNFTVQEAIPDREGKICYKKAPGLDVKAIELKEYHWLPSGYNSNPLYVTSEGKYILIGKTFDGCPVKDSILVRQKCDPELHVPDAFSPDGDGRNDYFQVFGHEVTTFDIKIFDRWGELIYHSTDFRFHWDGTYRNQTVPIGTYPYVITYSGTTFEGNKVSQTLSGDVTVVK